MSRRNNSHEELFETIKSEALRDSELLSKKKRFGLFNYQTPLAICDSETSHSKPKRDANGQVITLPRNIQTTGIKSGKIKSSYLSVPSYITIGDQYIDPDKQQRLLELAKKAKIPKDYPIFKTQNSYKQICGTSPYKHESDLPQSTKISRTNSERLKKNYVYLTIFIDKVVLSPFNIVTGPFRYQIKYPHMKDEYERLQESESKKIWNHKALMKEKPAFNNADVGNKNFFSDRKTYEVTDNMRRKKEQAPTKLKILIHEQPFKYPSPGKKVISDYYIHLKGYNRTINKYPQYMESPIKEIVSRKTNPDDPKKESFKIGHPQLLTTPSPTISCNRVNLHREILSNFSSIQFKN